MHVNLSPQSQYLIELACRKRLSAPPHESLLTEEDRRALMNINTLIGPSLLSSIPHRYAPIIVDTLAWLESQSDENGPEWAPRAARSANDQLTSGRISGDWLSPKQRLD